MMNHSIEIVLDNHERFESFLNNKVKEYNNEHSIHHLAARKKGAVQPINIMVSDERGQWIGGISSEVYWDWVELNYFWFDKAYRGQGIGGILLDKTDTLAKEQGATKALVTTFEFQARTFYEMKGFTVVGEVKDYPPGSSYYTLVKSII
jgi:GNAT superfamily N-acetyltransferase